MSLCKICSSLPIRDVLRYFSGDELSLSTVFWWKDPLNSYEREFKPFLKLHNTLRELECSADDCPLCQFICECLQDSFRYNTSTRKNDQNSVWLRLQFKSFDVFLGNASEPEFVVSGTISLSATRGMIVFSREAGQDRLRAHTRRQRMCAVPRLLQCDR